MSETHTAAQPGRNMALDNSRTIGCFLIVVVHACMSGWYGMDPSSALWKFNLGGIAASYAAVSLFFMISGALDTMSKVESQLKMHNYDGFFK